MDELEKARAVAASRDIQQTALLHFNKQITSWGIALPNTQPLVLDFGLGQFEAFGLIEIWIANEISAGYCGKYLYISDGQTCPSHHHTNKHETFFVVEGRVKVVLADDSMELNKGDLLTIPPLTKHCFTGIGPSLLLELSQPCRVDDNHFEDKRIPIGRNYFDRDPKIKVKG